MHRIVESVLGKRESIERIRERREKNEGRVMIVEFYDKKDAKGILESREEIRLCWGMRVDENLTMRKRTNRCRMVEKARRERQKEKWIRMTNKRIWIEGEMGRRKRRVGANGDKRREIKGEERKGEKKRG